jgi:hypothetical protein
MRRHSIARRTLLQGTGGLALTGAFARRSVAGK